MAGAGNIRDEQDLVKQPGFCLGRLGVPEGAWKSRSAFCFGPAEASVPPQEAPWEMSRAVGYRV